MPVSLAFGQRSRSNAVEFPGPQPRSTARATRSSGTRVRSSRAARVRSSPNFRYWASFQSAKAVQDNLRRRRTCARVAVLAQPTGERARMGERVLGARGDWERSLRAISARASFHARCTIQEVERSRRAASASSSRDIQSGKQKLCFRPERLLIFRLFLDATKQLSNQGGLDCGTASGGKTPTTLAAPDAPLATRARAGGGPVLSDALGRSRAVHVHFEKSERSAESAIF